jgi:hypothetical protein
LLNGLRARDAHIGLKIKETCSAGIANDQLLALVDLWESVGGYVDARRCCCSTARTRCGW